MRSWLGLIAVCLVVGIVIGLITGLAGVEMPWWSWVIVGVVIATVTSIWEAYGRRKNAPGETVVEEEVEEEVRESED
ncbi:MAG: hypothetical protein ACO3CR_01585 [Solirubrobacterales bacterium]